MIENIKTAFVIFFPWFVLAVIMDNNSVAANPVDGDVRHLFCHLVGNKIDFSEIIQGSVSNLCFLAIECSKYVLIRKKKSAAV